MIATTIVSVHQAYNVGIIIAKMIIPQVEVTGPSQQIVVQVSSHYLISVLYTLSILMYNLHTVQN